MWRSTSALILRTEYLTAAISRSSFTAPRLARGVLFHSIGAFAWAITANQGCDVDDSPLRVSCGFATGRNGRNGQNTKFQNAKLQKNVLRLLLKRPTRLAAHPGHLA